MLYSFVGTDVENSLEARMMARPAHVERLVDLKNKGRLIIAGPNPAIDSSDPGKAGFSGSIIIAEFASLSDAEKWADEDPYMLTGVYDCVSVKPFNKALP